jgi:hypothetical protein
MVPTTHNLIDASGNIDRAAVMREAWTIYRRVRSWRPTVSFGSQLECAWRIARQNRHEVRMSRISNPILRAFASVGAPVYIIGAL